MELQDAYRVRCATFLLTRDARLWWESASVSVNLQTLTWEGYKEVFYSKYFTEELCSCLTKDFMTLQQGERSVAEFVRKFERGCHFMPIIANDSREKLRCFIDGLRPILHRGIRVAGPTTYIVVVSRALAAEQDQKDIENDRQGKRPYQAPQQQQFKRPFQGQQGKRTFQIPSKGKVPIPQGKATQKTGEYPMCSKCNRQHMGHCLWGLGKCFKGGASDHMLKDCQQWRQPTQRRVFAMHAEEAKPDTTLLAGNIFIKRVATKALLDSGATHSSISETFANYLGVKSIGLHVRYSVTVPSREELLATSMKELNMRKRWWLELVKDYDCEIRYHQEKATVVADALSRKVAVVAQLSAQRSFQ
ncbi:uncharacterized protein LOC142528405 [Primulina tabacum]|uniref:uncharacterized protein LOC142528405 n=1 Tax=Primulina tabacum TaxID=48773 RepID=UPI003F5A3DCF